jgi:Lrp/AsnC family transcriptional regulator, regulator for asnA, asnC and gidA
VTMVQRADVELDDLDLKILREMEADGRQSISALAKTLGISRAYAGKRLQSLLDRDVTRIVNFTDPRVLGFRTMAIVGIQVSLADLHAAADRLRALPSVHLVMITAGPHNIVAEAMFANPEDLSALLTRDLGNIPGIKSTETTTVLEWRKMSFSYLASSGLVAGRSRRKQLPASERTAEVVSNVAVDDLDLQILNELEADGRQPVSDLAKKLGTSRAYMSSRLQRILDQRIARVVAHTSPLALGYHDRHQGAAQRHECHRGQAALPAECERRCHRGRAARHHHLDHVPHAHRPVRLSGEGTGRDTGHHIGGMHHPAGAEEDVVSVPGAVAPCGAGRAEGNQGSAAKAASLAGISGSRQYYHSTHGQALLCMWRATFAWILFVFILVLAIVGMVLQLCVSDRS